MLIARHHRYAPPPRTVRRAEPASAQVLAGVAHFGFERTASSRELTAASPSSMSAARRSPQRRNAAATRSRRRASTCSGFAHRCTHTAAAVGQRRLCSFLDLPWVSRGRRSCWTQRRERPLARSLGRRLAAAAAAGAPALKKVPGGVINLLVLPTTGCLGKRKLFYRNSANWTTCLGSLERARRADQFHTLVHRSELPRCGAMVMGVHRPRARQRGVHASPCLVQSTAKS